MFDAVGRALARVEAILTRRRLTTAEKRLRFYIGVSNGIVSFGLFSFIYSRKFDLEKTLGASDIPGVITRLGERRFWSDIGSLLQEQPTVVLLAVFTYVWYLRYSGAVRHEMDILARLYSAFNPPSRWQSVIGMRWVPLLSVGLTVVYLVMAWNVDRLPVYCLLVMALNVLDMRGNALVRMNLTAHFADPRFVPPETDRHRDFIMRRREVAAAYWILRPQLERIGVVMLVTMVAFVTVFSDEVFGMPLPRELSYLLVMAAIIGNEVTMARWRRVRDGALAAIEREQEDANRRRSREQGGYPA